MKCNRCGQCCMNPDGSPCKYLVFLKDGTTKCKVYFRDRLGRSVGYKNFVCMPRVMTPTDFEGCPYNTNKKIIKVIVKK